MRTYPSLYIPMEKKTKSAGVRALCEQWMAGASEEQLQEATENFHELLKVLMKIARRQLQEERAASEEQGVERP